MIRLPLAPPSLGGENWGEWGYRIEKRKKAD
ncbi:hypothetical protein SAMN05216463_11776 [Xylanibacter ruminicola]|uniref:Uncharacterized protein n=1 Tax=Xylanibacter ruminicola TaxID=839 RepID=A0A1M6WPI5_XYLRU|nr:hypothetical protein SAMN05216463_11776 [Xylanibacter ruminicola]